MPEQIGFADGLTLIEAVNGLEIFNGLLFLIQLKIGLDPKLLPDAEMETSVTAQTEFTLFVMVKLGAINGFTVILIRLETFVVETKQAGNVPPVVNLAEIISPLDGTKL